jgi:hypothetical protein
MGKSLKDQLPDDRIAETPFGDVFIYTVGICYASACAPIALEGKDVAEAVNLLQPTGLEHGWAVSEDLTFSSGESNPCSCQEDPERRHWLLAVQPRGCGERSDDLYTVPATDGSAPRVRGTVEREMLSGQAELSTDDEAAIRDAGEHLLAFIGPEPCSVCGSRRLCTGEDCSSSDVPF